ncbi:unnamed protein product, partial [Didymodactylos carnosus]
MSRQPLFMSTSQFSNYPTNFQQQREGRFAGNNVDSSLSLNRRPSLLGNYHHNHYGSPERLNPFYLPVAQCTMGPHVDEHSKRARYPAGANLSVNSQLLPLRIDVKKESVYEPLTEAISPTPEDPKQQDSSVKDTTSIRASIVKLESEIESTSQRLKHAKQNQREIKNQAEQSAACEAENEIDDHTKLNGSQTLIEKILHENRKKAEDGYKVFSQLNNNIDLTIPLYHEPSDIDSIQKVRKQYHGVMKRKLISLFKKSHEDYLRRTKFESEKYDGSYQQWQKKIEKQEKQMIQTDITQYRDCFEKTFPEFRKIREDKEKLQRTYNRATSSANLSNVNTNTGQVLNSNTTHTNNNTNNGSNNSSNMNYVRSEAELEQVADGLQEIEEEERKMRRLSVIPPILYDRWQRKHEYYNLNGLIQGDAAEFWKRHTKMAYWTYEEKQIFVEKFTQSPKNFSFIASFLESKTTEDCIMFYYMTKKAENYKNLLRKQTQTRRKAKQVINAISTSSSLQQMNMQNMTGGQVNAQQKDNDRTYDPTDSDKNFDESRGKDQTQLGGNSGEDSDKRSNKNQCQILSCTTIIPEKTGKKKNRKNKLKPFPSKWNDLSTEQRETIRRSLEIPVKCASCCARCYDKLIVQVKQAYTVQQNEPDEDGEPTEDGNANNVNINKESLNNDETYKCSKLTIVLQNPKSSVDGEDWSEADLDAFVQARLQFGDDWLKIAEHIHRSEESCRTCYIKQRCQLDKLMLIQKEKEENENQTIDDRTEMKDQQQAEDDENYSECDPNAVSMSTLVVCEDDNDIKTINDDSNESAKMVIDEQDQQQMEDNDKIQNGNLTTITSLVAKEISKTLNETEKRPTTTLPNEQSIIITDVIARPSSQQVASSTQPPPLVTLKATTTVTTAAGSTISVSPPATSTTTLYKGSIMRGTPLPTTLSPSSSSSKSTVVDTSHKASHLHPHYSPRQQDEQQLRHLIIDSPKMNSSKVLDLANEQHQLLLQQREQQYRSGHHSDYKNINPQVFYPHHAFPHPYHLQKPPASLTTPSTSSTTTPGSSGKSSALPVCSQDIVSAETFETLRADFVTSKYLTSTVNERHGPSSSGRSSEQQQHSPSPIVLPSGTPNSSSQASGSTPSNAHPHASVAPLLYPHDLITSGVLPYSSYYSSLPVPGNPLFNFYDPRLIHDYTTAAAANSDQFKADQHKINSAAATRIRHHLAPSNVANSSENYHTPTKRTQVENMEHIRYNDYTWRQQMKNSPGNDSRQHHLYANVENPISKLAELSHWSNRSERNS